jgi:hypothetical protein
MEAAQSSTRQTASRFGEQFLSEYTRTPRRQLRVAPLSAAVRPAMNKHEKLKDPTTEKPEMESKPETQKVVTTRNTEIENIHAAAREDAGFEKILKFKKGEYFTGEEAVPLGTKFVAHAVGWTKCWIKFVDGELADRKVYRVALGEKPPERDELDDLDESKWPKLDGEPADPWTYQYMLPFENPSSGDVVIFVTPSFGGRRAVAELCSAYTKRVRKVPQCGQPIIKLAKTTFTSAKFGKVLRPLFEIDGWDETGGDGVEIVPPTLKADLNDEIPF